MQPAAQAAPVHLGQDPPKPAAQAPAQGTRGALVQVGTLTPVVVQADEKIDEYSGKAVKMGIDLGFCFDFYT